MDKATLERLRQFAGAISRATNSLVIRKAQDLQKHGDHDQSTHNPHQGGGGGQPRFSHGGAVSSMDAHTLSGRRDRFRVSEGSGVASGKDVRIAHHSEIKTNGRGVPTNIEGAYKPIDWKREAAVQYEDGKYDVLPKNRLSPIEDVVDPYNRMGTKDEKKSTESGDVEKHGEHDQSTHNPHGAGAVNARNDRMYAEARRLEMERLGRGEKPNPNLTDTVSSRTSIVGEHNIFEVKGPDGQPRYVTNYKPSEMFRGQESERPLGTHSSLEAAQARVQEHKDSMIAEHNARAREQKNKMVDALRNAVSKLSFQRRIK